MAQIYNVKNKNYEPSSKRKIIKPIQNIIPQQMFIPQNMGGLEYVYVLDPMTELNNCTGVFIKQQAELFEAITGCETANRYLVFGQSPEGFKLLFKCRERSDWFMRNCCPSNLREFNMEIEHITPSPINPMEPPILSTFANAIKPFKCTMWCLCRPELFLTLGEGEIGNVKHVFTCFDPLFEVYDENKQLKYLVTADCCQCGLLCANNVCGKMSEAHFNILNPGSNQEVGRIIKQTASSFSEMVTDADSYQIIFPADANAKDKLLLLSLGLMIDYQFFETNSSDQGYGRRRRRPYYY